MILNSAHLHCTDILFTKLLSPKFRLWEHQTHTTCILGHGYFVRHVRCETHRMACCANVTWGSCRKKLRPQPRWAADLSLTSLAAITATGCRQLETWIEVQCEFWLQLRGQRPNSIQFEWRSQIQHESNCLWGQLELCSPKYKSKSAACLTPDLKISTWDIVMCTMWLLLTHLCDKACRVQSLIPSQRV